MSTYIPKIREIDTNVEQNTLEITHPSNISHNSSNSEQFQLTDKGFEYSGNRELNTLEEDSLEKLIPTNQSISNNEIQSDQSMLNDICRSFEDLSISDIYTRSL